LALTPGTRLGVDDITRESAWAEGRGLSATDSNLKRSVAIEVLFASVVGDAERVAFSAKPRSSRPSTIWTSGRLRLEKTPDLTALLMELAEGEDLSQRIAPGAIFGRWRLADREADRRGARSSASRPRSVKDCHSEAGAVRCKVKTNDEIVMLTILGAGGAIGHELVKLLAAKNQPFRLVGRNPKATPGATETLAADLTDRDQTVRAVAGSSVVHLLVGLKYDRRINVVT
jgi:hypothetical protein